MEVYGAAIRESVSLLRGAGEASPFSSKSRVRARQRASVAMKLWSDDGPRLYYASPPRCGGVRDAKRKDKKKRAALVTELSKDLAALCSMELGMDGGEGIAGEVRANMIKDSAELLLAQLNHQKSKEKEMKKRKKEEKEAMKAALKMRNCAEMSSSSSSSESSDSDCEEVAVMDKPRKKNLQEEEDKPNILDQSPECNQAQSSPKLEEDDNDGLNLTKLKFESEIISNCMNSIAGAIPECNQAQSSPEVKVDDNDELNLTKLKLKSELSSYCMNSIAVPIPECNQAQSSPEVEKDDNDELNLTKLKLESEIISNCMNSIAVAIPECNQAQPSPEVEEDDNDELNLTKLKLDSEISSNYMNSIAVPIPEFNQAQSSPEVEKNDNDELNLTKLKLKSEIISNCMNSIAVAIPECNQAQSSPEVEKNDNDELNLTKLKLKSELSSNCMNSIAVAMPLDKIEVCLGGKCKKSGAMDLLKELEKKIGIGGAVTGCKCMGKCKEGPNVRIVNHCSLQDEFGEVSKKVLCIGVGLEDVSAIVANFLGEKNMDMSFLGA